ncbi:MAG: pilus assembly protein [Pirellulales bacterium]|nr:pilus assembly protein [Pirellulales bacterium]
MIVSRSTRTRQQRPLGLATLEMVLALPILLFVMALMVNFGTLTCWKVRALSVGRQAAWGTRWPRTGFNDPRPDYWPAGANATAVGAGNVPELDDPRVNHPVARGPLPYGTTVRSELLDPTRGLRRGTAEITRRPAMLGKMGPYELRARTHILDDKWQYQRMGMSSNRQRRIPVIYVLEKAARSYVSAYKGTVSAILNASFRSDLAPLDRDEEFLYYGQMFGWGNRAPDFHPALRGFSCSLDRSSAQRAVDRLIDHIEGEVIRGPDGRIVRRIPSVAQRMAGAFAGLYNRVVQEYERQIQTVPPLPASEVAPLQTQIAELKARIETLNEFATRLQTDHGPATQPNGG